MISVIIRYNNKSFIKPNSIFKLNQRNYCSTNNNTNGLSKEISELPIYYHRDLQSNKDIFLIGSLHLSKNSANQVQKFIQDVKPDTVVLELCEERYQKMKRDIYSKDLSTYEKPEMPKIPFLESLGKFGGFMGGNFMEYVNRFYSAVKMLGLVPGLEFILAIKEADKLGAQIVLGDTPVRDTMSKIQYSIKNEIMSMRNNQELEKLNDILSPILYKLSQKDVTEKEIEEEFKKILNNKVLKEIRSIFQRELPITYEAILLGRERNMVRSIKQSKGSTIVTVAGALHIDGIKELLNLPLDKIPAPLPPPPQSSSSLDSGLLDMLNNNNNNNNNSFNNNNNNFNNLNNLNNLFNNDNIKNMLNNNNFKNMLNNNNFNNLLNNNNNNFNNNNNNNNLKNLFGKFLKPKD